MNKIKNEYQKLKLNAFEIVRVENKHTREWNNQAII